MTTYAIGDVHGCLNALDTLLAQVPLGPDDRLVFLGDLIDRGPDSKGVVQRILDLRRTRSVRAIQGNHEEMILVSRYDKVYRNAWFNCGGRETVRSYGWEEMSSLPWTASLPRDHWIFFQEELEDCVELDGHILVHGSLDASKPISEQHWDELRWQKWDDPEPHVSGKMLVCGHTPQMSGKPLALPYAICIDTWVYGDGWLTALNLDTLEYYQSNQRGESRRGCVDE